MPTTEIIGIKGSGVYFPKKKVRIESIAKNYGIDPNKVLQYHGVEEIHIAEHHETELYMATKAVEAALIDSKLSPKNIDLVVYCRGLTLKKSAAPYSSEIIKSINAKEGYGFDIEAGFIGGLMGIQIANDIIINNFNINNAVVVASQEFDEIYLFNKGQSRINQMVFGDGAAAVVLSKQALNNKILSSNFMIDHSSEFIEGLIRSEYKDKSILKKFIHRINPVAIIKDVAAAGFISKVYERLVVNTYSTINLSIKTANLDISDVSHFIKTQISLKETEMLAKMLDIDINKIYNASSEKGHLGQADILSNLHLALGNHDFRNMDIIVLVAANYDCSAGAIVLRR